MGNIRPVQAIFSRTEKTHRNHEISDEWPDKKIQIPERVPLVLSGDHSGLPRVIEKTAGINDGTHFP
jgi:hypothetical protein